MIHCKCSIDYDKKKGQPQTLYLNEAGLYDLMMRSKMPKAKNFSRWVTHTVLPSLRKYGSYKIKKEYDTKMNEIMEKINFLEQENTKIKKENTTIKKDLKKEEFPIGGMVYVVDYSTDNEMAYRIGMTKDMNKRKKIYDTHTLHKRKVVYFKETEYPVRLEACIRVLLYEDRYQDNKDFFVCSLDKIKRAFKRSITSIEYIKKYDRGSKKYHKQCGGSNAQDIISKKLQILKTNKLRLKKKIDTIERKLNE